MNIVFDLDNTLANNEHRQYILDGSPEESVDKWPEFFARCGSDVPIIPVIEVFRAVRFWSLGNHRVEIWSGRSEGENKEIREMTMDWLRTHVSMGFVEATAAYFPNKDICQVRMRPFGNHQPDDVLKLNWLREATAQWQRPDLVFDDRQLVVDMWRVEGVPCLQFQHSEIPQV